MKLTKEQVAIERKKFETIFFIPSFATFNIESRRYVAESSHNHHALRTINIALCGWLASRESNNEIIVPDCIDDDDTHDREKLMYNRGLLDCASAIESQGYTIKESK